MINIEKDIKKSTQKEFRGLLCFYVFTVKALLLAKKIAFELASPSHICAFGKAFEQKEGKGLDEKLFFLEKPCGSLKNKRVSFEFNTSGQLSKTLCTYWQDFDVHIFVGATGIAVRTIAPMLESKLIDPAVLSCDENGSFVVSLVSGHIGGANRLARLVAEATKGQAVISTATDVQGLIAFDEIAMQEHARILNPKAIRSLNAALLANKSIAFLGEKSIYDKYLANVNVVYRESAQDVQENYAFCWDYFFESDETGVNKSEGKQTKKDIIDQFLTQYRLKDALFIDSKSFVLGIGCRKGVDSKQMQKNLEILLQEHDIPQKSIALIASCHLKSQEKAILDLRDSLGIETVFFAEDVLNTVKTPNPSVRVSEKVGTASVSEAAALYASNYPKVKRLYIPKTAYDSCMTFALARLAHGCDEE